MDRMDARKPHLIIITGRPAAGKTTLAKWLAKELGLPFISKDSIREVLFDSLGWKDREWAKILGESSVNLMFYFAEMQLEAGSSLILDNAFDPALSTSRFHELKILYNAETIQIICNANREILLDRFLTRAGSGNRHPGHRDEEVFAELQATLAQEKSPIMDIGGSVLELDMADFNKIDYQVLLSQVKRILSLN